MITLAGLLGNLLPLTSAAAAPSYTLSSAIPAETDNRHITKPKDIAVDAAGHRYVVDERLGIVIFDAHGDYVETWPMNNAVAIAAGINNRLYVLEGQGYVRILDESGGVVGNIGKGAGSTLPGYFLFPEDVAVDSDGSVYVADSGNNRIQKFDPSGNHVLTLGTGAVGVNVGEFDKPTGIAVDADKNMYVVDQNNHRVQKFDANGANPVVWGSQGSNPNQLQFPSQLYVVDGGAHEGLYITDSNGRVQKINLELTMIDAEAIGSAGGGEGFLNAPKGIAVDGNGNLYVTDRYRAQVFDATGSYIASLGGSKDGQFLEALYLAADSEGNLYVADRMNHRILKYDSTGQFVLKWGSYGSGQGQFDEPMAIAIDKAGAVYVADHGNDRVQKFGADGSFITEWDGDGTIAGKFQFITGIATDSLDNVYVADGHNHTIQKFSSTGIVKAKWGAQGAGDDQFNNPQGIAIDASDNLYIADFNNHRIVKYTANGSLLTKWGVSGNADGQFSGPFGVAVDEAGTVYVVDSGWGRVQTFTTEGEFITKWSEFLSYPRGIAVTGSGDIAVMNLVPNQVVFYTEVKPLTDLTAVAGDGTVTLSFSPPTGAASINVEYSEDGGATWEWGETAAPLTAASTSAIVTGLRNGATYQFRLNVLGGKHQGTSNIASAAPQASSSGGSGGGNNGGGNGGGGGAPVLSSNADLAALSLNTGTLSPQFSRSATNYQAKVAHEIRSIEVTAKLDDANAVLHIGETKRTSGEALLIPLEVGSNTIEIEVTAQNGTKKRYVLEVERAAPPVQPDPDSVTETPQVSFSDLAGHWAKEAIIQAIGKGIAKGYPDQTFRPDQPVTRAEFVAFIAQSKGWTNSGDFALPFTDLDDIPSWAQGHVAIAVKEGILTGYEDGSFRAQKPITRTEAVSVMMRLVKQPPSTDAETDFADDRDIPDWGKGYVSKAVERGIVAGRSGNRFAPGDSVTRAETVVLLTRLSQQ
ncbi:S-layer homology domain-containing protein [Cohnella hongkongensis]|uniref:S-layer homology domain-containing protein n=1 Tax=Cohnella hongkongensis TaxID=178337 RepID=A0ABV9FLZ0_9BACL